VRRFMVADPIGVNLKKRTGQSSFVKWEICVSLRPMRKKG
jgi:hypothetical protein